MFVVLEGIDGCGKSTQAKLLYDWMIKGGKRAELTAEPTRDGIGNLIREILSGNEKVDPKTLALLFTADRYEHLKNKIELAISDGKVVISERYYHSTIAYQSAQGVDRKWLTELNSFARKPDLVIFLDIKPGIAIRRIREKIEMKKQVLKKKMSELKDARERYSREASKYHMRMFDSYIKKDPGAIARQPLEVSTQNINRQMNELSREIDKIEEELKRERMKHIKFEKFEKLVGFGDEDYELFLTRVYENYRQFTDMTFVDGSNPAAKVFEDIRNILAGYI